MIETRLQQAESAFRRGNLDRARALAEYELTVDPDGIDAWTLLGIVEAQMTNFARAQECLERALTLDEDKLEARIALASVHASRREPDKAREQAFRACELAPDDPEVWSHFGRILAGTDGHEEAVAAFAKALELRPDHWPHVQNVAAALQNSGREHEAIEMWRRVLKLAPDHLIALMSLGRLLMAHGRFAEALPFARSAARVAPQSGEARLLVALALAELGRSSESEPHLRAAIDLSPEEGIAHASLGFWLQEQGRFDEARPALEEAVRLRPSHGFAQYNLVRARRAEEADRQGLAELESLAASPEIHPRDAGYIRYALGKAHEDLGDFEIAMRHYDAANDIAYKIWLGERGWDRDAYAQQFDAKIRTFDQAFFEALGSRGSDSEKPLLIVGMPRSGTSLVEQILSSHPEIEGAGELPFWHENEARLFKGGVFDATELEDVAHEYLEKLQEIARQAERVTDKLPHNYALLGVIHAALPNARIIHVRRDPRDTCLSIFTTAYQRPPVFAHSKENIAFAHAQYARLMAHWRKTLPTDRFLEVDYEEIVADREGQARRMLEFIDLAWDEALLHHEANRRSVRTPSLWQVRQPLYTTSIGRWRRFEPWLGALAVGESR